MLRSRLPKITREMLPAVEAALELGAETVEFAAKDRVSVRTGRLRDSIHVEHHGALDFEVVAGDDDTFYGHIVEHGGANSAPRPFMVPALHASRAKVIADVRAAIKRVT